MFCLVVKSQPVLSPVSLSNDINPRLGGGCLRGCSAALRWGGGCLGHTQGTCKAAPPALAAVLTGTTPGESMPIHHKSAFWFPFHPPLRGALCQLSFCINQREIFSPSCFFSFPEQIGCHYVQLSLLRGRRGREEGGNEETVIEKHLQSIRGGKQPPATSNQPFTHTLIYWGNPQSFNM